MWSLGLYLITSLLAAGSRDVPTVAWSDFAEKEKAGFEIREKERLGILEDLDSINAEQNRVRRHLLEVQSQKQELEMALANLTLEVQKQKSLEQLQRKRVELLLRIVYKVRRDGMLRYLVSGANLSDLSARFRILYRTLRSHGVFVQQLQDRAHRLVESEYRLQNTQKIASQVASELKEQEQLLSDWLQKKKQMLSRINRKQSTYLAVVREQKKINRKVSAMFAELETSRDTEPVIDNKKQILISPVAQGRLIQRFGKKVHEKFQTVTFNKGIEIASNHAEPVQAVADGTIEFEGWVKGLGNVLIVHHGGTLYTLNAHLFKSNRAQGEKVAQGDVIGFVGDTGESSVPSLYFELRENGRAVNPLPYLNDQGRKALESIANLSSAESAGNPS